MKRCENCNIEVGGNLKACPLCKSKLVGSDERPYWPSQTKLKKKSKLYKIQLAIALLACVTSIVVDKIIHPEPDVTWWPLFVLWIVAAELVIRIVMKRYRPIPEIATEFAVSVGALLGFTSIWYPDLFYMIPVLIVITVGLDLSFVLLDKRGYTMVFLIYAILIGAITSIAAIIFTPGDAWLWSISLGVCICASLTVLIANGRFVLSEIKRRFSM